MKTLFPKKEAHIPKWFVIDATNKTLGRLSTEASKLLRGKETSFFTPGVDQGNFVIILNAEKIEVTGKKEKKKKIQNAAPDTASTLGKIPRPHTHLLQSI